jgi:hypothetical protein
MSTRLPPGHQWRHHSGKREQARNLKRIQAQQAKVRATIAGVDVDERGRTPAGLIVPGMEPRQPMRVKPRWS